MPTNQKGTMEQSLWTAPAADQPAATAAPSARDIERAMREMFESMDEVIAEQRERTQAFRVIRDDVSELARLKY